VPKKIVERESALNDSAIPDDTSLAERVEKLAAALSARGWKMAAAESCTGGWVAKCCTDRAGSSEWFERGFVTYSNAAKIESLGVRSDTLDTEGAVSREVALQMAEGARRAAGAEIAVAVTGIAGPDGGTQDKPVGTVWFAWSQAGCSEAELHRLDGDRETVRRRSVACALQGLIDRLVP
jgi:nicotinamide-nucleotide amidase